MEKNSSVLRAILRMYIALGRDCVVSDVYLGYLHLYVGKSGRLILHYYHGVGDDAAIYVDTLDFIDYRTLDKELGNIATISVKNDKNCNILRAIVKLYELNNLEDKVVYNILCGVLSEEFGKSGRLILTHETRRWSDSIYVDTLDILTESEFLSEFPNVFDVV